jgi:hypothetical protein
MFKIGYKLLFKFLGYTLSLNLMAYPILVYGSSEPTELTQITEQIQKYLCQVNLCLNVIPNIEINPELKNYGFFFRKTHSIQLSPSADTGQLKLSLLHEYTHAIRYHYNQNELLWLDEGLANLMEYRFSGIWPVSYSTKLRQELNLILSNSEEDFKPQGRGYVGSFLFIVYLYNHFHCHPV